MCVRNKQQQQKMPDEKFPRVIMEEDNFSMEELHSSLPLLFLVLNLN